jgi:hypothetical protein
VRFDSALHAALAERLPALVALVGGSEPYAASVGRLAHMFDVAVRHVDRLLASAGGPHLPRASAAPSGPGDPVGAALLDALAACHGPRPLPDATRAAWLHAWAAMRHLLRPPAPPATAAR